MSTRLPKGISQSGFTRTPVLARPCDRIIDVPPIDFGGAAVRVTIVEDQLVMDLGDLMRACRVGCPSGVSTPKSWESL